MGGGLVGNTVDKISMVMVRLGVGLTVGMRIRQKPM